MTSLKGLRLYSVDGFSDSNAPLVFIDDNFSLCSVDYTKWYGAQKTYSVKGFCKIVILNNASIANLSTRLNIPESNCEVIIVVSPQFDRLFHKSKLILLERERSIIEQMEDFYNADDLDEMTISWEEMKAIGEIEAMSKYGVWRSAITFNKENGKVLRSEMVVGSKYKKLRKREAKVEKMAGAAGGMAGILQQAFSEAMAATATNDDTIIDV